MPVASLSNEQVGALPQSSYSALGLANASGYSPPSTVNLTRYGFTINSTISVPVGTAAAVQLQLQDNIGEAFLFAYFDPYVSYCLYSNEDHFSSVSCNL